MRVFVFLCASARLGWAGDVETRAARRHGHAQPPADEALYSRQKGRLGNVHLFYALFLLLYFVRVAHLSYLLRERLWFVCEALELRTAF